MGLEGMGIRQEKMVLALCKLLIDKRILSVSAAHAIDKKSWNNFNGWTENCRSG